MERINIEEILKKHGVVASFNTPYGSTVRAAIKEIAEAIVDKCAEKAEVDIDSFDVCSDMPKVGKQSILQVKDLIDYETK